MRRFLFQLAIATALSTAATGAYAKTVDANGNVLDLDAVQDPDVYNNLTYSPYGSSNKINSGTQNKINIFKGKNNKLDFLQIGNDNSINLNTEVLYPIGNYDYYTSASPFGTAINNSRIVAQERGNKNIFAIELQKVDINQLKENNFSTTFIGSNNQAYYYASNTDDTAITSNVTGGDNLVEQHVNFQAIPDNNRGASNTITTTITGDANYVRNIEFGKKNTIVENISSPINTGKSSYSKNDIYTSIGGDNNKINLFVSGYNTHELLPFQSNYNVHIGGNRNIFTSGHAAGGFGNKDNQQTIIVNGDDNNFTTEQSQIVKISDGNNNNKANVTISGNGNHNYFTTPGTYGIIQKGDYNQGVVNLDGNQNQFAIDQTSNPVTGKGNYAEINAYNAGMISAYQNANRNTFAIVQTGGDTNRAVLTVDANRLYSYATDNRLLVRQNGTGNEALQTVKGSSTNTNLQPASALPIVQIGYRNHEIDTITGDNNSLLSQVVGNNTQEHNTITGSDNKVNVSITNRATLDPTNKDLANTVEIILKGDSNNVKNAILNGDSNVVGLGADGSGNLFDVAVTGDRNLVLAGLTGTGNQAKANISGNDNQMRLIGAGTGNTFNATQTGNRNTLVGQEVGISNSLTTTQTGGNNFLAYDIQGQGNTFNGTQKGNDKLAILINGAGNNITYNQPAGVTPTTFFVTGNNRNIPFTQIK